MPRNFLGEFETDFAVFQFQMRRKRASFFRNELRQKIGLAGGDKFLHLLLGNFAVQNHLAYAKSACLRRSDRVFASVGPLENINLPFLANWTQAERLVPRGVDFLFGIEPVLAEVELRLFVVANFHHCFEWPPYSGTKALQRPDPSFR